MTIYLLVIIVPVGLIKKLVKALISAFLSEDSSLAVRRLPLRGRLFSCV